MREARAGHGADLIGVAWMRVLHTMLAAGGGRRLLYLSVGILFSQELLHINGATLGYGL